MSDMSDFKDYQRRKMAMANLPFPFVKFAISPLAPPATYLTNDRLTVCNCFLELDATPLPLLPLDLDPASTGDGGWHTSRFYQTMCPGQRMSQLKIFEWV